MLKEIEMIIPRNTKGRFVYPETRYYLLVQSEAQGRSKHVVLLLECPVNGAVVAV